MQTNNTTLNLYSYILIVFIGGGALFLFKHKRLHKPKSFFEVLKLIYEFLRLVYISGITAYLLADFFIILVFKAGETVIEFIPKINAFKIALLCALLGESVLKSFLQKVRNKVFGKDRKIKRKL